jgi:hypothetical protein
VHYAEANRTNRLRWVYTSYRIPADTLCTGAAWARLAEFGIEFEDWDDVPEAPVEEAPRAKRRKSKAA